MVSDPFLLLSLVNTALRDNYSSFEDYCYDTGVDGEEIENLLSSIGYFYDKNVNSFKQK